MVKEKSVKPPFRKTHHFEVARGKIKDLNAFN